LIYMLLLLSEVNDQFVSDDMKEFPIALSILVLEFDIINGITGRKIAVEVLFKCRSLNFSECEEWLCFLLYFCLVVLYFLIEMATEW